VAQIRSWIAVQPFGGSRRHRRGASGVDPFDRLHQGGPQLVKHIPLRCTRLDGSFDPPSINASASAAAEIRPQKVGGREQAPYAGD